MLAVKPEIGHKPQDCSSIAATVHTDLAEIVASITTYFDTASLALGDAVTTIDQIVTALQHVATVFDTGEAATAVGNLIETAENLRTVTRQVDSRARAVVELRKSSATLRSCAGDILRCIQVLDVYGMNVKINASGSAEFMDFADRMRGKLFSASDEVRSLDKTLALLESSLCEMNRNDALLVEECAKVIPQIPDQLVRDAQALEQHQAGLLRLAQATNDIAKATRNELGLAISAIQIGDRVRQRLEHVMFGCQLVDDVAVTVGGDISHADALQSHFLPLLGALTRAAAAEFNEDAKALVVSLSRLKETSMQLTSLQGGDRCKNGQGFLELLKCGITDANGMIAQLSQADRQGTVTRAQIMATIDDVTAKMAAITELRLEVRNMAINIGLRCRNVGELGKPIAVVANEIRSYSDRLDLIVSAISSAEASLMASSSLMSREGAERPTSSSQLSGLLDIIEACDRSTADALDFVESNSSNVQSSLDRAIMQLQPLVENAELIANVAELLNLPETSEISRGVVVSDELKSIFESLRVKYTMTAEREIHISILKSMGIHDESLDVPVSDEDCDDEFDDGLF